MRMIFVARPAIEPVTLAEAKTHLRVDDSANDALITQLIMTARQSLDGRDGLLGRALINQTWKLTHDGFPRAIEIPLPPLQSIVEIAYTDANGNAQTIDLQTITVEGIGDAAPAIVRPVSGTSWPSTADHPEAVQITFTAGYGAAAADVPGPIKQAVLMHIASMYEQRESVTVGSGFMTETPHGYRDLVSDYRLWGF